MAQRKRSTKPKAATEPTSARSRKARPYPASSFNDALPLGEAIMKHAAGEKVRRLTLLQQMDKSPNSGPTKMMITNSGKYGITTVQIAGAERIPLLLVSVPRASFAQQGARPGDHRRDNTGSARRCAPIAQRSRGIDDGDAHIRAESSNRIKAHKGQSLSAKSAAVQE